MAWTNIPTSEIDQDSPVTQPLMTAIRDNISWVNPYITKASYSATSYASFSLPSTYETFMFSFHHVSPAGPTSAILNAQISTNNATSYDSGSSDYRYEYEVRRMASSPEVSNTGGTDSSIALATGVHPTNAYGLTGQLFIHDCNRNARNFMNWNLNYYVYNNNFGLMRGSGVRNTSLDWTHIRFFFTTGIANQTISTIDSGEITLYGWRNS